jgi:signal transduction histidine kinase
MRSVILTHVVDPAADAPEPQVRVPPLSAGQRVALGAAGVGTWSVDLRSREVTLDARACALFGLTAASFAGTLEAVLARVHPDDVAAATACARAIAQSPSVKLELRTRAPERSLSVHGQLERGADGTPSSVSGVVLEAHPAPADRATDTLWHSVADTLPAAVAYVDAGLRCLFANRFLTSWYGRPVIEGTPFGEIVGTATFARLEPMLRRVLSGERVTFEVQLDWPRLPPIWVSSTLMPDRAASGEVRGFAWIAEDLSISHAERARLEQAVRARDAFLATVSHELRTPLTAILGYATMLRHGSISPERTPRALETIERNARAQARLVEDLLDASRIISGKMVLRVAPISPRLIVEASLDSVRPAASAKGISLDTELDCAVESIVADPDRLQQIVWNLLSNAIKFTPARGHVQVRLREAGDSLEIIVSDDGKGIATEFMPHVFERFRQQDSSASRHHGGLGLGLALVKHLVELHGGTVSAESRGDGGGSRFTVTLPRVARPPETNETTLAGARVLLVAASPQRRHEHLNWLSAQRALVRWVASPADALVELGGELADVIVCDLHVDELKALIQLLRALPAAVGGEVPIVDLRGLTEPARRVSQVAAALVRR